ncbi:MAG: type II toxin-antitoxin system RelE/ParE family toxin [Planctomycetaceae bacterium]|nr:type II toxin-antitoxin system RelE/ParE family toxin [Planctomycetaceae bacterium]
MAAEAAVRHIAEQSPVAAEQVRAALFAATDVLAQFPEIGAMYEGDECGRTREINCYRYRIFYRVRPVERRVDIILLWHSARQEPQLPS